MVSREQRRRIETSAISSTAARKGPSFAFDGLLNPLVFLTNWRQAARTSSLFKIQMRKKFSCDGNLIGFLFDHCATQVILSGHGDRTQDRSAATVFGFFAIHHHQLIFGCWTTHLLLKGEDGSLDFAGIDRVEAYGKKSALWELDICLEGYAEYQGLGAVAGSSLGQTWRALFAHAERHRGWQAPQCLTTTIGGKIQSAAESLARPFD